MNKLSLILIQTLLVLISLSLTSCSWMTGFVVQNKSEYDIKIEYSLCCPGYKYWYTPPKMVESRKLGFRGPNWNEIPEVTHGYDYKKGIVSFYLPKNISALVAQDINYTGYDKNDKSFYILEMKFITPNGEIVYKGNELHKRFEKRSKNLYLLKYQ